MREKMSSAPSLLRSRDAPGHGRVGFIELFFDLVFVFAVTQISHLLIVHFDLKTVLEAAFLTLAMWTVWMWTTWATNWLDCERAATRLMMFALMAGGLVLAAAIPGAFGARGLAFALAYAAMQNGRNLFLLYALREGSANERLNFQRVQFWITLSGALWIAGGFVSGAERWALWGAALFLEFASPWWSLWTPGLGRSSTEDWQVDPEHMAERCGLFVIIALGESVVLIGATFAGLPWAPAYGGAFAIAFVSAAAIWWVYFAVGAEEAREEFSHRGDLGRIARDAYSYAHVVIVAGVIVAAVGNQLLLGQPTGRAETALVFTVLGGPAIFLIGNCWFCASFGGAPPRSHLAGLGALAAAALASPHLNPLALGAVAAGTLGLIGVWESLAPSAPASGARLASALEAGENKAET
jgi:low temperature requirement protein LtrA